MWLLLVGGPRILSPMLDVLIKFLQAQELAVLRAQLDWPKRAFE